MGGVRAGREAALQRVGEMLRTHRKYAGWFRLFDVLRTHGCTTVGRVADELGKDYHGTYVQIGRFRRFVTAYSRTLARELGATVDLEIDGDSDPPSLRLTVRPVVQEGQMLRLEESDRAALREIAARFRCALPSGPMAASQVLALREYAVSALDTLDGIVWRNRERGPMPARDGGGA